MPNLRKTAEFSGSKKLRERLFDKVFFRDCFGRWDCLIHPTVPESKKHDYYWECPRREECQRIKKAGNRRWVREAIKLAKQK